MIFKIKGLNYHIKTLIMLSLRKLLPPLLASTVIFTSLAGLLYLGGTSSRKWTLFILISFLTIYIIFLFILTYVIDIIDENILLVNVILAIVFCTANIFVLFFSPNELILVYSSFAMIPLVIITWVVIGWPNSIGIWPYTDKDNICPKCDLVMQGFNRGERYGGHSDQHLVSCQLSSVGYNLLSLTRASSVVNCQLTLASRLFR